MKIGRTEKAIKNIVFALMNQMMLVILNFIGRAIFIQVLGETYLGLNGLIADILTMLSLADMGMTTAMIYSFYEPLAVDDKDKISALITFYKKLYNYIAAIVAIVGMLIMPFLKHIVNIEGYFPFLYAYYLLMLSNTVISYLFVYKTSIINADQKNFIISKYQMIFSFLKIILQCTVLLKTKSYAAYLTIQIGCSILTNLFLTRKACKLYPYIMEKRKIEDTTKREVLDNVKAMAVYKISLVIFGGTDNIIISMLEGTKWVGYCSNYNMVITAINNFVNVIYTSITSGIGNVIYSENEKKRYQIFESVQTISFMISSFATACIYSLIQDLINIWLGMRYLIDIEILIAIVINFYLAGILHPIWSYREATGLYRKTRYIMLIAAVENIVLSMLMCKMMGISGVFFASAISRLTTYFWYEPYILFSTYFSQNVKKFYLPLFNNAIYTLILCIAGNYVSILFEVDSWMELIIKSIVMASLFMLLIIARYWKNESFQGVYKNIIKRRIDFH
jgi:O-antigen/teichoic acid export membrane protein